MLSAIGFHFINQENINMYSIRGTDLGNKLHEILDIVIKNSGRIRGIDSIYSKKCFGCV